MGFHHLEEITHTFIQHETNSSQINKWSLPHYRCIPISFLYTTASVPSLMSLFLHVDSFFSVKAHQSRALLSLAAIQDCMAWLRGHMLSRCGLCGISGWLHMLSDDKQRIRSDRSWLRTFVSNESVWFVLQLVLFHVNYQCVMDSFSERLHL